MGKLLIQEETIWRQRAQVHWFQGGDLNTCFFHQSASSRKKKNKIIKLKNEEGRRIEGQEGLCDLVGNYYTNLFTASNRSANSFNFLDAVDSMISAEQNVALTRDFTVDEFLRAIK